MRTIRGLMVVMGALLGLSSMVMAADLAPAALTAPEQVVAHTTQRGQDVPIYFLGEVDAPNTAEGLDGFAIHVAYVLRAWTAQSSFEAIANLCHTPDGAKWGALILTIHSHSASPRTDACPDGMVASGVNEHSHPQHMTYPPNAIDKLFLQHPDVTRVATLPDTFSDADYAQPGYMVGYRELHFQNGVGTVRTVWKMTEPEPTATDLAAR